MCIYECIYVYIYIYTGIGNIPYCVFPIGYSLLTKQVCRKRHTNIEKEIYT